LEKIVLWENFAGAKFSPKFFWGKYLLRDNFPKFLGKIFGQIFLLWGNFLLFGKICHIFWGYNILYFKDLDFLG